MNKIWCNLVVDPTSGLTQASTRSTDWIFPELGFPQTTAYNI